MVPWNAPTQGLAWLRQGSQPFFRGGTRPPSSPGFRILVLDLSFGYSSFVYRVGAWWFNSEDSGSVVLGFRFWVSRVGFCVETLWFGDENLGFGV